MRAIEGVGGMGIDVVLTEKTRDGCATPLERAMGLEPTTLGLGSRCSTTELRPLGCLRLYYAQLGLML